MLADIEFPPTIATNGGIAEASFILANPFGATITLHSIIANATHKGFFLGIIDLPQLPQGLVAPGHTSVTSPLLPLEFDIDPIHIIQLVAMLGMSLWHLSSHCLLTHILYPAAERSVDLGPLPELFAIVIANPSFHPNITATPTNSSDGCSR